jgi:hypothetical protein
MGFAGAGGEGHTTGGGDGQLMGGVGSPPENADSGIISALNGCMLTP